MSNVTNPNAQDYPFNLLDDIFGEDEYVPPSDFAPTLAYVLAGLTEREQAVLTARYKDRRTYENIGREMNVTMERIRQIELKALHKLRHPIRREMLLCGVREYYLNREINTALKKITRASEAMARIAEAAEKTDGEINAARIDAEICKNDSIDMLDLSVRAYNCLKRANIRTLGDLTEQTEEQLKRIRNLGQRSCEEVIAKMREYGLELKESTEDEPIIDGQTILKGFAGGELHQ